MFSASNITRLDVNNLMDIVALGDWSVTPNDWKGIDFTHSSGVSFWLRCIPCYEWEEVFNMETLRAYGNCSCSQDCDCTDNGSSYCLETCKEYGTVYECRHCDSYGVPFEIGSDADDYDDDTDETICLDDFRELRHFADSVVVLASYSVSPIIGELIRDELADTSNGFEHPYSINGYANFFRRGAFTLDLSDLSAVKFVGASGAMRVEFDAIDLMDADNLGELIAWIQSGKLRGCPAGSVTGQKVAV
jgi:hypothetical protein